MKKIIASALLLFSFSVWGYCSDYSYTYQSLVDSKKNQISNALYSSGRGGYSWVAQWAIDSLNSELASLESQLQAEKDRYQECLRSEQRVAEASALFEKGYNSYNLGKFTEAISYFTQYLQVNTDSSDVDYQTARNNLKLAYFEQGQLEFDRKKWDEAITNFKNVLTIDQNDFASNYNIWAAYYNKKEYQNALSYYEAAYTNALTKADIDATSKAIQELKSLIQTEKDKKNAPSNDALSYLQYYLKALNIPSAWNKVKNSKEVIVAVIDDGVNINHPDLVGKIWVSPLAKYGDSKIIDFVGDKLAANLPTWEHWTMIAGIIAASTNNNEGIAGIAKNAKIMPLRVFGFDGVAKDDNIIRAMNYAIDNGANIINLSLWWSQFDTYTDKYDSVIKRAYDKGIIVVIAAGNGDVLTQSQTGIDLSVNPISPVCNNKGSTKYSIGVAAMDMDGYKTWWTNYNGCIFAFAPGVAIVSTSIPVFNSEYGINYNLADGTSFSAPIVSGIIALWYNQYGYVSPKIVQECLIASAVKNGAGNLQIDAAKYLDALTKRLKTIQQEQADNNLRISNQQAIDSNSDANVLASFGIINKQDNEEAYGLNNAVLRQEVIGMAMKLTGSTLPTDYACKKIFKDVSATKPNTWICRAVEFAVENGIVSGANKNFNPESNITRAEALAILMKAAGIKVQEWGASKYADVTVPWQINIVNTAFSYSFIDAADSFYPNKNATRGEIFNMAKRILKSKN